MIGFYRILTGSDVQTSPEALHVQAHMANHHGYVMNQGQPFDSYRGERIPGLSFPWPATFYRFVHLVLNVSLKKGPSGVPTGSRGRTRVAISPF